MLLPQELKKKAFTRAMRGYEPAEVDEFIDFLVEKYSEVYTQCDRYDKKLRLVADRISQIQSEEEAIKKLAVSTQKLCENMTAEAEEESRRIKDDANAEAEAIITEARETSEAALASINQKSEEKIHFIERKSDELLLSVRTKCAGILNDFKKDIAAQKESIISLKSMTDEFNKIITETYRRQIADIENNVPELKIDFNSFNESKLLAEIMNDIKNDAVKIANDEQWSSNSDFEADLEKLKSGKYSGAAEAVKKEPVENESRITAEKKPEGDIGMTKTVPLQKPDKNSAAEESLKERNTEEFDIVKYKNEIEKPFPQKPLDNVREKMNAQNQPDKKEDINDDNGGGYDESDGAGEYDAYEEDDEEAGKNDEPDRRSGKKKGFLGLFRRDKPEKKNKYNDDEDVDDDAYDDDDDYDDDDYDDDEDDDYYGLKNNDSRRTESSIFDD